MMLSKIILYFFLIVLFVSCKKSDTIAPSETNLSKTVQRKWLASTSNTAGLAWVEFLYGNTYLVKNSDGSLQKGSYSFQNDSTIIQLSGLGTIQVESLTNTGFNFTFNRINNNSSARIFSTPSTSVVFSNNVDLLCAQSWYIDKVYEYMGPGIYDTLYYPHTDQSGFSTLSTNVIFSDNGTYFVSEITQYLGSNDTFFFTSNWDWANIAQDRIKLFDTGFTDTSFLNISTLTTSNFNSRVADIGDSTFYFFIH